MILYIAGPMSKRPYHNYPFFDYIRDWLRRQPGVEAVVSPADLNRALHPDCERREGFAEGTGEKGSGEYRWSVMLDDIGAVLAADAVVMLPEWETSSGAVLERRVAEATGKRILLVLPGTEMGMPQAEWVLLEDPIQVRLDSESLLATEQYQRLTREMAEAAGGQPNIEPVGETLNEQRRWAEAHTTRTFEGGATRDDDARKHDPEGYLSPLVLRRYNEYMHKHGTFQDEQRASDNWQSGFGLPVAMKSAWRHFQDWWSLHRSVPTEDFDGVPVDIEEAICALIFNASAYLHELLKQRRPNE